MFFKNYKRMKAHSYQPPTLNLVQSYYRRPNLDVITGRTTLEWINDLGKTEKLTVNNRFTDYEGNRPSWNSIVALPYIAWTYFSSRKSPVLKNPVPFLVIDAISFLSKIIFPGMKILEAGGGNSTLWFLKKQCHVTTIEHSASWAQIISSHIASNPGVYRASRLDMNVMQGHDAVEFIEHQPDRSFDLVLIDSMNEFTRRNHCMKAALKKVKRGGWMVLDNSDNPVNHAGADLMNDFPQIKFTGYSPMCLFVCQTSFWQL
jgi:hypothetical protein